MGLVMPTRTPVYAFGIGGSRDPSAGVPAVLRLCGDPEITHPVIRRVSIFVIECFWQPTPVVEPDQSVGHVVSLGNTNSHISPIID